jgi:hypothetical protein
MRAPMTKHCRICGKPVVPVIRTDRAAYRYPRQCAECCHKARNEALRRIRIGASNSGMNHPRAVPIGTRRTHNSGDGLVYYEVKVSPRGRWRLEHRVVMEKILGKKLKTSEHVHHLNGDTLDNHPSNLRLVSNSAHFHIHHAPLESWAKHYPACRMCGTTTKKHLGGGLCSTCYQRVHWKPHK